VVDNFKYLGSIVESTGRVNMEISQRIENKGIFYNMIKDILWKWDSPKAAKVYCIRLTAFLL
jgi:hypothetical protein